MTNQEEQNKVNETEKPSIWKTNEARVFMYIIPAAIILTVVAYLLKQ